MLGSDFRSAQGAEQDYDHLFKIVLVGEQGVGKTHLLARYLKNEPSKDIVPTIGVEFETKTITLQDGPRVKAQIWDTAGEEKYRSITSTHYRRAVGALLVYDVTRKQSFEQIEKWIVDLREVGEPGIIIKLVGNKLDLVEKNSNKREVPYKDGLEFAENNELLFEETSAITGENVASVFERLLEAIYDEKNSHNNSRNVVLDNPEPHNRNSLEQGPCEC